MAELRKWIREYEITFSGPTERLVITSIGQRDPLDISFKVSYDPANMQQGTLDLSVFGLKESNVAKVMQTGVKVWLKVGYRDPKGRDQETRSNLTTLFIGDIRAANVISTNTKHETKIKCISSRVGSKPLRFKFPAGVTNSERIKECLREIRRIVPELIIDRALEDVDKLQADEPSASTLALIGLEHRALLEQQVYGTLTVNDTCSNVLKDIVKTFNISVTVINDEIRLVRKGGSADGLQLIGAVLGDNLLSPPRRRLDNMKVPPGSTLSKDLYEFTMLLEPELNPNDIVSLSHLRNDLGTVVRTDTIVKVTEVSHIGKYRGNQWYTAAAGTIDEDFLGRSPLLSVVYDMENTYIEPKIGEPGSSFLT